MLIFVGVIGEGVANQKSPKQKKFENHCSSQTHVFWATMLYRFFANYAGINMEWFYSIYKYQYNRQCLSIGIQEV